MAAEQTDTGGCETGRPFVSVLMPAYNCASSITAAMGSVLCETRVPLELIVVDDASTDATPALIDMMAEGDPRVRVVHRAENGGDGPACNTGLDLVRGEWLVLLDADDLFAEDGLFTLAGHMRATTADILITDFRYYDCIDGSEHHLRTGFHARHVGGGPFDPRSEAGCLLAKAMSGIANKAYRMERIRSLGLRFQEIPRVGDLCFTLGACALARSIECVEADYYIYRINCGPSLTMVGDAYPLAIVWASAALKDLLEEHGVWDVWQRGFLDWFVTQVPFNLAGMREEKAFRALVDELRESSLDDFGFNALPSSDFADVRSYRLCRAIREDASYDELRRMMAAPSESDSRTGDEA